MKHPNEKKKENFEKRFAGEFGPISDAAAPVPDASGVPEGVYSVLKPSKKFVSQENYHRYRRLTEETVSEK